MTANILLVAAREFRQIAGTRSFWLTLLILPLAFAIGPIASRFIDKPDTDTVMLVDQTGGETARAITRRLEIDRQRSAMLDLSRYVARHDLERAAPGAAWTQDGRWFTDAEVERFVAEGGVEAARARLARVSPEDAAGFAAPDPLYKLVTTPAEVAAARGPAVDRALAPFLRPADGSEREPVDYVVLVPPEFGRSPTVRLWANGQPRTSFVTTLQGVLTERLRTGYLQANGVARQTAEAASAAAPAIAVTSPPVGRGRERVLIRSILPLGCAYLLLMSLILSGSWMLQGTVEERSNKLLESVLACVSPNELMYGKLIGMVAIGLSMVATWVTCGLIAAFFTQGAIAEVLRPALEPVSTAGAVATIVFFFVAGYVMVSVLFLAIGAMSESMRDAQGYLTPVILLIMLPFTVLMQAVLGGADGVGVHVMTWIPLYTPFAVLARLGSGIAWWEAVGSGLLLVAFIAVELVLLGRVFRASLLAGGARPGLGAILRRMRRAG